MSSVIATVVLEPPCTILEDHQSKILGESGSHAVQEMLDKMGKGHHFFEFFVVVLLEELFARGLFLGLLPDSTAIWNSRVLPSFLPRQRNLGVHPYL